jgi:hypothetical protein
MAGLDCHSANTGVWGVIWAIEDEANTPKAIKIDANLFIAF